MEGASEGRKDLKISFATGNENKFLEAKSILPNIDLQQLNVDLPEIQSVELEEIIKSKLLEALKHSEGPVMVEDTGLYLECLNGLPGPLIKWFEKRIGLYGISEICEKMGEDKAVARTIIGCAFSEKEIRLFEGSIKGRIVHPRKGTGFGWDSIFVPEGRDKAFSEMRAEEKNAISMRRKALEKLREFLESRLGL